MLTTGAITKDEKEIWKIFERGYRVKPQETAGYIRTYVARLLRQSEGEAIRIRSKYIWILL